MMTLYWPSMTAALVAAHVLANVVWIGALLSETLILGRATWLSDLAEIGTLARRVHTRLAIPAFLGSLASGLARLCPRGMSTQGCRGCMRSLASPSSSSCCIT